MREGSGGEGGGWSVTLLGGEGRAQVLEKPF